MFVCYISKVKGKELMNMVKLKKILPLLISVSFLLCGCGNNSTNDNNNGDDSGDNNLGSDYVPPINEPSTDEDYSYASETLKKIVDTDESEDLDNSSNENTILITGNGDSIDTLSSEVNFSNGVVSILKGGSYLIKGTINGSILINTTDAYVHLILEDTNINNASYTGAPLASFGALKTTVTLKGSNEITDGTSYKKISFIGKDSVALSEKPKAALYSYYDLTVNGDGKLTINSTVKNGITVTNGNYLQLDSANVIANAYEHGLKAGFNVILKGGVLNINSSLGDGIKVEDSDADDVEYTLDYVVSNNIGNIVAQNTAITLVTYGDGFDAFNYLIINSGTLNVKTYLSYQSNSSLPIDSDGEAISAKAFKSKYHLEINGGTFIVNAADDAFHSDLDMVIYGGDIDIYTGDDAFHAGDYDEGKVDSYLTIGVLDDDEGNNDINIDINYSYEGIEAAKVTINGGNINLYSTDDGINAADGSSQNNMGNSNSNCQIIIAGGVFNMDCLGDAIDSNGSLLFRGGEFYVQGPSSSANASIDTDGDAYFDGGEIIALDGGQMTELPNSNSQQCVLVYSGLSITKNQELKVIDSENVTLMSIIPNKSYTSLYMSSYQFKVGSTYTIYSGTTKLNEVTLTGTVTNNGVSSNPGFSGGNGPGGGRH